MKNPNEMTLGEVEHIISINFDSTLGSAGVLTYNEAIRAAQDIQNLRYILGIIRNYHEKHPTLTPHSCPQCRAPKKEKEKPVHFSLDT